MTLQKLPTILATTRALGLLAALPDDARIVDVVISWDYGTDLPRADVTLLVPPSGLAEFRHLASHLGMTCLGVVEDPKNVWETWGNGIDRLRSLTWRPPAEDGDQVPKSMTAATAALARLEGREALQAGLEGREAVLARCRWEDQ